MMPGGARDSVGPDDGSKMDVDDHKAEDEEQDNDDDKLYCVCKTRYDQNRVMIACDRCVKALSSDC